MHVSHITRKLDVSCILEANKLNTNQKRKGGTMKTPEKGGGGAKVNAISI